MAVAEEGGGVAGRITTCTPVPDVSHNLPDSRVVLWESLLAAGLQQGIHRHSFPDNDPGLGQDADDAVSSHCCRGPSNDRHSLVMCCCIMSAGLTEVCAGPSYGLFLKWSLFSEDVS